MMYKLIKEKQEEQGNPFKAKQEKRINKGEDQKSRKDKSNNNENNNNNNNNNDKSTRHLGTPWLV